MAPLRSRFILGYRRRAVVATFVAAIGLALAATTGSASGFAASSTRAVHAVVQNPPDQAARGLQYRGLVSDPSGPCGDHFRLTVAGPHALCSHGPDPAPAGVDVTKVRSTSDLLASGVSSTPNHAGSVRCIGDGVSGPRVQAVYAVASDQPDRYAQLLASMASWAGEIDGVYSQSAAESGGDRHVRFVTNPDCTINIAHVVLAPSADDSFSNEITALQQLGFSHSLTKYLVWTDAAIYCGIAQLVSDDSAGATNINNTMTEYARIDSGCWGRTDHLSEAHELMHILGGVQASAPHATVNGHCTDESDAMCYADAAGVTLTYPCPPGHEWLFDCNDDDYYDASPSAGSYLASHWDAARSQFLDDPNATVVATTTTTAPPATTTTTTAPPTTTTTFSGSLSSRQTKKTFALKVGTSSVSSALQFSASGKTKSATSLQLRVLGANGTVVVSGAGPSVLALAATVPAGTYTWEVSGSSSASFTLTVKYTP